MKGYQHNFLGNNHPVYFPDYRYYKNDAAINNETGDALLPYIYYSVIQSKVRRVPVLSASNIYRTAFTQVERSGHFKRDNRINDHEQLGSADYALFNTVKKATIEKGHMTKREDVQWDENNDESNSEAAARSTFFYPNASPQHDALNNGVWKQLENSIIIKGRVKIPAKVSVFTGPVLDGEDPLLKTGLNDGTPFRIPVLFWKVVYYIKPDNNLYYAGFLMGQLNPLRKDNLIKYTVRRELGLPARRSSLRPFLDFEENEKYQIPVAMIEELTHLKFPGAIDLQKNGKPLKLKLKDMQVRILSPGFQAVSQVQVDGLNV